jgi:prepilin-type N-terminal cleavage/methylation domain-containing protein
MSIVRVKQDGFTLVELVIAMAVFSFMLLIITAGFMNIVRMHNMAIASNYAQDNARTAMDELVRAVRDSTTMAVTNDAGGTGLDELCVSDATGSKKVYYVQSKVLYRATGCPSPGTNKQAITNSYVAVKFISAAPTNDASLPKPAYEITLTVGSDNSTTGGAGTATTCTGNAQSRQFCSVVTLTSGAVPR